MRVRSAVTVAVAALGIALGGCTGTGPARGRSSASVTVGPDLSTAPASVDPSADPSASVDPSASGGAGAGQSAACIVGTWRSTNVDSSVRTGAVTGDLSGGSGFTMTVSPDGLTVVDFTGMQPVAFTSQATSVDIQGSFWYGGKASAAMTLPPGVASGTWRPVGPVDFSGATVTVDLQRPVVAKVADNMPLPQFSGGEAGGSVDPQPVLREGTFECSGGTLKVGPPVGTLFAGTWTFRRA